MKRSSAAASPGLRSGWFSRASLRYAFLISSAEAFFATPRVLVEVVHSPSVFGARDHDPCRPQHAVAEPVALLQHLDHGALLRLGRLREQRLVDVRVEGALGRDLLEALLAQRVRERAVHEANALLELRLLVLVRGHERPLEVVEHGQELLDEPLGGTRDQALLVARGALAVVVELGREALEVVEVLLGLRLGLGEALLSARAPSSASASTASSLRTSSVTTPSAALRR